jgi:2'-5' RNA ligase
MGTKTMNKELMWVCALLPSELNEQLTAICKEENKSIGLSENVFQFPLHISMKKSFQTTEFESVKAEIINYIHSQGKICCHIDRVGLYKNMLWLPVDSSGCIMDWHNRLDYLLLDRYTIPIDRFDEAFQPHISLYTKGSKERLLEMQNRLSRRIAPMDLVINRFVIGSSLHKDEYFEI